MKVKFLYLIILIYIFSSCSETTNPNNISDNKLQKTEKAQTIYNIINNEGKTISEKFNPPVNFERIKTKSDSFSYYLQTFPLKQIENSSFKDEPDNKFSESILDIDTRYENIEKPKDFIIKLLSEYFYKNEQYSQIKFYTYSGFKMSFPTWSKGYRITSLNNKLSWTLLEDKSNDYNSLVKFLNTVYKYSTESTIKKLCKPISLEEMYIGDIFFNENYPNHYAIVVDMAQNIKTGGKAFILCQCNISTKEIYITKNVYTTELSPWYPIVFEGNLELPETIYSKYDLKRFKFLI